jgi:O-acetyl-ADP-ribose deacetylase (regulator of RNase III)
MESITDSYEKLPFGVCCPTLAGNLDFKHILHTIGPIYSKKAPHISELLL